MRYSKKNIINQHLEFCKAYGIEITQADITLWYTIPTKFLNKMLTETRRIVAKKHSVA